MDTRQCLPVLHLVREDAKRKNEAAYAINKLDFVIVKVQGMPDVEPENFFWFFDFMDEPEDLKVRTVGGRTIQLSEQIGLLMQGDSGARKDFSDFGKKAVPWLSRALLLTPDGSPGRNEVLGAINDLKCLSSAGWRLTPALRLIRNEGNFQVVDDLLPVADCLLRGDERRKEVLWDTGRERRRLIGVAIRQCRGSLGQAGAF